MFSPTLKPLSEVSIDNQKFHQALLAAGLTPVQLHIASMCLQCHTHRDFVKWYKVMPPEYYQLMETIRQYLLAIMLDLVEDSDLPDMTAYWKTL